MSEYKNNNGMSWLIIQIIREIITGAGSTLYRKINLTFLFADCIYAMTGKFDIAQTRISNSRELLKAIRDSYDPGLDDPAQVLFAFEKRSKFELRIDDVMRDLLCVANDWNLINPSQMEEKIAPDWHSIKARNQ